MCTNIVRILKPLVRRFYIFSMSVPTLGLVIFSACTTELNNPVPIQIQDSPSLPSSSSTGKLTLSPSSLSLQHSSVYHFSATDGIPPYTWSLASGVGQINSNGTYTAPSSNGIDVVKVTDAAEKIGYVTIIIVDSPQISPGSLSLALGNQFGFSVIGGNSPYSYSIISGNGTVDSSGNFIASNSISGTTQLRVTDRFGYTSDATIQVNPTLSLSPQSPLVSAGSTITFTASGGVQPYSFSALAGSGLILSSSNSTAVYQASSAPGMDAIQVKGKMPGVILQ